MIVNPSLTKEKPWYVQSSQNMQPVKQKRREQHETSSKKHLQNAGIPYIHVLIVPIKCFHEKKLLLKTET